MAVAEVQPFSIDAFQVLFRNSRARKYLSKMEIEQVYTALEERNIKLLRTLYHILLREKTADEEIVRDFVMTKNHIIDGFNVEAAAIEKKHVHGPKKQKMAHEEEQEKVLAEGLIEDL